MLLDIRFFCRPESKSVVMAELLAQIMSLFHWACQCVQFIFYIPKTRQPLCAIICTLSMFIAELTLPMGESTLKVLINLKHHLCIVVDVDKCRICNVVCLQQLQTMGFMLNVGQQIPSYVKGRQAGRCKESCWCCAALAMEEAALHIRLPEHCWQ